MSAAPSGRLSRGANASKACKAGVAADPIALARLVKRPQSFDGAERARPANTSIITAEALTDPNTPAAAIQRTDATLGGRPAMSWFWQNDPLFRVRYRYA